MHVSITEDSSEEVLAVSFLWDKSLQFCYYNVSSSPPKTISNTNSPENR